MLNLYKVKVYRKREEKIEGKSVISFLDSVVVKVLPEDMIFNVTREFYTGEPLLIINKMEEIDSYNDSELFIFKNDFNKNNKLKYDSTIMKYYDEYIEKSLFNKYLSTDEKEKVKKKEVDYNE
ncbi:MAG: hypothetical protein IJF92_03935 [Bacilli bacterium]|nr:hypothetical protein [Bacilli bacterium]